MVTTEQIISFRGRVFGASQLDGLAAPSPIWSSYYPAAYTGYASMTADKITLISASDDDDAGGIGATSVTVEGIDGNGRIVSEDIGITGLVEVASVHSYTAVNSLLVHKSGTDRGLNVGRIWCFRSSGSSDVMATIDPQEGRSQKSIFLMPAGFSGVLKNVVVRCDASSAYTVDGFVAAIDINQETAMRKLLSFRLSDIRDRPPEWQWSPDVQTVPSVLGHGARLEVDSAEEIGVFFNRISSVPEDQVEVSGSISMFLTPRRN